jgi:hypothetical protein
MTSELPVIPACTDDCEGGGNQLITRRSALRDQLDTRSQSPGVALCSGPIATGAEADSGYSSGVWLMPLLLLASLIFAGQSVSAGGDLPVDSDCLQLSLSGCEAEKQTTTIDSTPKHRNFQLPSLA